MKLNKDKVAVLYGYKQLQFGFYNGGNAFMAVDGELVNAREEARKSGRTKSGYLRVRCDQPACILFTHKDNEK